RPPPRSGVSVAAPETPASPPARWLPRGQRDPRGHQRQQGRGQGEGGQRAHVQGQQRQQGRGQGEGGQRAHVQGQRRARGGAGRAASASVTSSPNSPPDRARGPWVTPGSPLAAARASATTAKASSMALPARSSAPRSSPVLVISTPPAYAPTRKPSRANRDADSEKPGAPTRANAAKTTLPVMFAGVHPAERQDRDRVHHAGDDRQREQQPARRPERGIGDQRPREAFLIRRVGVAHGVPLVRHISPSAHPSAPERHRGALASSIPAGVPHVSPPGRPQGEPAQLIGPGRTVNEPTFGFVGRHKPRTRPAGGGYKHLHDPVDLVYYFLRPHRTGESIQDKSQDDRLYICHQPAYD